MSNGNQKTEEFSLWECLHDGDIKEVRSDLMARTLTIVVDSPFHREFHKLAAGTCFEIVGENARIAEVLDFQAWPGAWIPPRDTPWREVEERRRADYEKGRLVSLDWNVFTAQVETGEGYEIMSAELEIRSTATVLSLALLSSVNYPNLKIHAERFRFYVGANELSLQSFLVFGSKYWDDWSEKSKTQESLTEAGKQAIWNGVRQQDV
jgi:hypothetical protein